VSNTNTESIAKCPCSSPSTEGMFLAQYQVLRENGHTPSEAFNETVEEATQSLFPLIGAKGMDYMYAACSTTARRGGTHTRLLHNQGHAADDISIISCYTYSSRYV
jgi:ketol-acid reductoisomerase